MIQINTLEGFEDVNDYYYVQGDTIYSKKGNLKVLKPWETGRGYHQVNLRTKNGKRKYCSVHRIVCTAYNPNPDPAVYTEVNHINHDRTDNRPENLEWTDRKGNTSENNVWVEKHKEHAKQHGKSLQKKVMLIDEENCKVIVFQSATQCAEYLGVTVGAVSNAIKNGRPCKGYELKLIKK